MIDMLHSLDEMRGYSIRAEDGEIGHIEDVYFDDLRWTIRYLVVDTAPWIFGRQVLISPLAFGEPDWANGVLPVNLTRDEVKNSPDIDLEKPVSRQKQEALHSYYNWDFYWLNLQTPTAYGGAGVVPPGGTVPKAEQTAQESQRREEDPHLRSVDEVTGYDINATDGRFGHVDDFLAGEASWIIRYLVVDTRDLLPGRHTLISPRWIRRVDWSEKDVHVDVDEEAIKNSPEYDGSTPVGREYEARLHDHYGRPVYW